MAEPTSGLTEPVGLTRSQARTLELMFLTDAQLLAQAADRAYAPIREDYRLAAEQCSKAAQLLAGLYAAGLDYPEQVAFLQEHAETVAGPNTDTAAFLAASAAFPGAVTP